MSTEAEAGAWPKIAVAGAGAVGCYFGGMLARAGAPVTLIGRRSHVDAMSGAGLLLEGLRIHERVSVRASTEISAAQDSEIVLICVKTVDTEVVANALRPHLAPGTTVISLQNGVDNVERIYSATRIEAIPAVVYVAAAMVAPGHVRHSGRGDLIIGCQSVPTEAGQNPRADLDALARMFERAEIPCRVSQTIKAELWTKMSLNCAFNAISALGRARYGRIVRSPEATDLMRRVIEETVAVARAEGVSLSEAGMIKAALELGEAMPGARSSTAQDVSRAKPTEIDSLNGYIVRRGLSLGVETPANQALHTLIKLLEQSVKDE